MAHHSIGTSPLSGPRLLTAPEKERSHNTSFISWSRLAEILVRVGECRYPEDIDGFTLDQSGGLTIYRSYRERG